MNNVYKKNSSSDNFKKNFTVHTAGAVPEYKYQQNINYDPILTSLRENFSYAVGNLTTAFAVATIMFSGIGSLLAANAPLTVKSPLETLQKVPLGFRDEFLKARAERKKNGTNVFRYIQKGNIEGLTDSKENGIGPGHGKSTSALEAAIANESSRSWKQVRSDALARALGDQSFNTFSKSINQQQTKAGLPKLTEFQLNNFMDVSFWKTPKKGEPNMARETGDSEYYQLPKLTSSVRASLITTKLNYQEQIVNEAVAVHNLTGKRLYIKLTGNQNLLAAEAKFVSAHLDAVRFASPTNKTQALLRLGSEPYIQPLETTPGKPPITLIPPEAPPSTGAPPGTPPLIAIPPATFSSSDPPPLLLVPPDTRSTTSNSLGIPPDTGSTTSNSSGIPPVALSSPDTPPTASPSTPPWNRPLVLIGAAAIVLIPLITDGDGDDADTHSSSATGGDGDDADTPPSPATTDISNEGFPNIPPSAATTDSSGDGSNGSPSEPTVDIPDIITNLPDDGSNGSPSEPTVDIPDIITNLPDDGCLTTPPSGSMGNTPTVIPNPAGDGCLNILPSAPTVDIPDFSPENPTSVSEIEPIPEPGYIVGLVAAGAGLLTAKFKLFSNKKYK